MNSIQLLNILIDRYGYKSYAGFNEFTDVECYRPTHGLPKHFDIIHLDCSTPTIEQNIQLALGHLNQYGCLVLQNCFTQIASIWRLIVQLRQLNNLDTMVVSEDGGIGLVFKVPNTDILSNDIGDTERCCVEWLRIISVNDLLGVLPAPRNHRNITVSVDAAWGRIGHQFNDIMTGPIVAELFGLKFCYKGFSDLDSNINNFINLADFYGRLDNENPVLALSTYLNARKWSGMSLEFLRRYVRVIPVNTNLVFRESTFFSMNSLLLAEQRHDVLPGTHAKLLKQLREYIVQTHLYKLFNSDFTDNSVVNVAVYVRGGGKIRDNAGYEYSKTIYDRILERIRQDYEGKQLRVVYYTQGPISDLVGDYSEEDVVICDDEYPRIYEIIKTFLTVDVFVAGNSGFSTTISMWRDGPTYCSSNRFALNGDNIII